MYRVLTSPCCFYYKKTYKVKEKRLIIGIIDKNVEIKLSNKMIPYYRKLGYHIPKSTEKYKSNCVTKGTSINVKISDISKGSHVPIHVICDNCEKEYKIPYKQYYKENRNGKVFCHSCANTLFISGENHGNWNFDKTVEERQDERKYPEYTEFVKKVLIRDNYICRVCGVKINKDTQAAVHHLDGYNWSIEKRIDVSNGICLCGKCHESFHSIYGYGNNTKEQFEEWIGFPLKNLDCNNVIPPTKKIYCIEDDKIYNSTKEICDLLGVNAGQVNICCNMNYPNRKVLKGKHYLKLSDYEKMSKDDIKQYLCNKQFKPVYCITTKETFKSIAEATRKYNANMEGIIKCCKNIGKYSSGKHPKTGEKLYWMYLDDYTKQKNA